MENEKLELVKAGCLGTCWYGKYHYVEPWVGCSFDCAYCYARSRSPVTSKLQELGSVFCSPVLFVPEDRLLQELQAEIKDKNVKIAKLSRFTDVFNPQFVAGGTALAVLKAMIDAGVERIIITTKGVPDGNIIDFLSAHKDRFSYNAALKPEREIKLEGNIPQLAERLAAASQIQKLGIKVTVHVDPLIPGIDDEKETFIQFLSTLKDLGLMRVMFSYLLLNDEIINTLTARCTPPVVRALLSQFESQPKMMLPGQAETLSLEYKSGLKKASVERVFEMLKQQGFEYVLCSLKSGKGNLNLNGENRRLCDGTFYA